MCIAGFIWDAHPEYPFLLLLNRDEYYSRPTKPLTWWECNRILGGRDGQAGGTWLACTRDGRVAFLTNVREISKLQDPKSRGELPVRFLEGTKSPIVFAEEILKEADQYNGFNLMLADLPTRTMIYVTNRPKDGNFVSKVPPGIHVLTNASLDTPWPKAQRLCNNFKELLDQYGEGELPIKELVEKLMTNTIKDEECLLPKIYPPEQEYYLSSIFVEADFPLGRYGTRSSSALSVKANGEVSFYEKYLYNGEWDDKTLIYQIEELK
ncbi:Transport and Golgi organization 2-like protein [Quillaja saponaria]|uniref:Transport and Golgi organization 2-like protein n=1 Tax=Quillaja saponaria TaxID=32244 RepID=A0AAD7LUJ6_QUISA|nr:Transport and Golgi organization 2-like protein [Quillaja saponaria]